MKFGYMSTLEMPPDKDYALHVDELREQAILCEQGLFDHVWLAEHHFGVHGRDNSPNPFMLATDIGCRTKRILLGIAVVVLPLWHPLRVAENITLLDQMLRGRVEMVSDARASRTRWQPSIRPRIRETKLVRVRCLRRVWRLSERLVPKSSSVTTESTMTCRRPV